MKIGRRVKDRARDAGPPLRARGRAQVGLQPGTTVDSVTAAAEATAPKSGSELVLVGVALAAGAILHAFGHGHGKTMIKNSIRAGGGRCWCRLLRLAVTAGTLDRRDLVAQVGNMITNAAAKL